MKVSISWSRAEPYPNISVAIKSIKALNLVTNTGVLVLGTSYVCWLGCYNYLTILTYECVLYGLWISSLSFVELTVDCLLTANILHCWLLLSFIFYRAVDYFYILSFVGLAGDSNRAAVLWVYDQQGWQALADVEVLFINTYNQFLAFSISRNGNLTHHFSLQIQQGPQPIPPVIPRRHGV